MAVAFVHTFPETFIGAMLVIHRVVEPKVACIFLALLGGQYLSRPDAWPPLLDRALAHPQQVEDEVQQGLDTVLSPSDVTDWAFDLFVVTIRLLRQGQLAWYTYLRAHWPEHLGRQLTSGLHEFQRVLDTTTPSSQPLHVFYHLQDPLTALGFRADMLTKVSLRHRAQGPYDCPYFRARPRGADVQGPSLFEMFIQDGRPIIMVYAKHAWALSVLYQWLTTCTIWGGGAEAFGLEYARVELLSLIIPFLWAREGPLAVS